jgi:potassium efflux system protein
VGFLLALAALGFQLTQLTIMISAFGVGIGFGLQNIVNNGYGKLYGVST